MKISVTKEDISRGRKGSCSRCPIALATARGLGWEDTYFRWSNGNLIKNITVDEFYIFVWDRDTNANNYRLPPEASEFVRNFDGGICVQPIEFEVSLSLN